VSLQDVRGARHAAEVLEGLLHEPPFAFCRVRIEESGHPVIEVGTYDLPVAQVCTPRRVNSLSVVIVDMARKRSRLEPKGE
jgi:hypothetical protein